MVFIRNLSDFANQTVNDEYIGWWVSAAVLSKVIIAITIYLVLTLALFEFRVRLKNKSNGGASFYAAVKTDFIADTMRHLCLAAAIFILLRSVTELLEIHEGQHSDAYCNTTRHAKAILHCAAISCLYLILWLRQRQFYRLPAFKFLYGRAIQFFSGSVIVIMAAANIITIVLYLSTRQYGSSGRGCVIVWSTVWIRLPDILLFIFTTTFQLILISLLLHPLIKHGSKSTVNRSKQREQVKRVSVAALVAIITTLVASLLSLTLLHRMHGAVHQLVNNIDILVTFLSILFSFNDWKSRLFSIFVRNKQIVATVKFHDRVTLRSISAKE